MLRLIEEIPGALERPGGCRVQMWQSENGAETTLVIPPRELSVWMIIAVAVLVINLLLIAVSGAALLFAHRSILFMAEISPGDLPVTLQRYEVLLAFGWGAMIALGAAFLTIMLRPLLQRELLTISPRGVTREVKIWRRSKRSEIIRESLRGFRLVRDPKQLEQSILIVQGRGEELVIAEMLREADREWLASVGTALLRDL